MNWKEISEKYPKGYDSFVRWDGTIVTIELDYIRNLYDFFDRNEIIVEMYLMCKGFSPTISKNCESPYVEINRALGSFKTRTEAEQATFEKAFEILEKKLNG